MELRARTLVLAEIDPRGEHWTPDQIAERLLGAGYLIRTVRCATESPGALARWESRWFILVAQDVSDDHLPAVVAHEVAEFVLRVYAVPVSAERRERLAARLAKVLLKPPRPPRRRTPKREGSGTKA